MLPLSKHEFDDFKENLCRRKKTFTVESKRGIKTIVMHNKRIAKLHRKSSLMFLEKKEVKDILSLFAIVKRSVNQKLIRDNFQVKEVEKRYTSSFTNKELFNSMNIGDEFYYIDVKHCYWRLAYLMGYITEFYYDKTKNNPSIKLYRNMALACIIAPNIVEYYKEGEYLHTIEEDIEMYDKVYSAIRHTSWNIFGSLAHERLGKFNCIAYYTDGIMVFKKDVAMVSTILARQKLKHRVIHCKKVEAKRIRFVEDGTYKKIIR